MRFFHTIMSGMTDDLGKCEQHVQTRNIRKFVLVESMFFAVSGFCASPSHFPSHSTFPSSSPSLSSAILFLFKIW